MCLQSKPRKYALFRKWDVLVIALVLALLAAVLFLTLSPARGGSAEVYVNGELFATLSLNEDGTLAIDDHMTVVVEGGELWVRDADCKDKICEKTGKISRPGQRIVCLPNRVVIAILGKGEVEAIS